MADENWQIIREIFDSAIRRKPEQRLGFVAEACGENQSLRLEVESLLASLDSAESFLEKPAVAEIAGEIGANVRRLGKGEQLGHYEIVRQIGAGGMGEVYLAEDKKLDRQVAVKILNENFATDESNLQRFVREAKAASALNHPNILVIHEIGEENKAHFIVSEFIKGRTLREMLRVKSLTLTEVLDISIQIANALAAAHEARLVHRDIKPENVMIRPDGFVKVLDFGLAKLVRQKNKSLLGLGESNFNQNDTAKGVILGTVNYMSPEQAKGENVDECTDIFSLGAVIYEMLAGQTPFAGETVSETFANLINIEPRPLSQYFTNLPPEFERVVAKMLCKKREKRYQTVKDLLADLKDARETLKADEKLERSAVPRDFQNNLEEAGDFQSQNSEQPANAFQAYQFWRIRYQQISPPDLIKGHELLEVAIRFDPDFALAQTAFVFQWIQEAIVGLRTPAESFPQAKAALQRAAELNPDLTEFYAAAGFIEMLCDWNFQAAEQKLSKALELNSHHAFANNLLGQVFMFQSQPDKAEPYLQQALEIEPTGLHYRIVLIMSYFLARNFQKAVEGCDRLLALYPRYFIAAQVRCWAFEQTGRVSEAVAEYEKILNEPHGEIARRWMGYAYAVNGNREKALETAALLEAESRQHYLSPTHQAQIYAGLNDADQAFYYLEKGIKERDPWMLWIAADTRYDNLRGDSRFDELLKQVGLKNDSYNLEEKLENTVSPNGNATLVLPTTTGEANLNTAETNNSISLAVKRHKPLVAFALIALLIVAIGFGYWFFTNRVANTKRIESIAVLPFVNESGNADTEHLSDGMTETLISSLSQLPNLNIKARSSVFRYKGKAIALPKIGQELNVQAILTGRVVQRGQDLILYLELTDAATENILWKADYSRPMTNLIALQSDVARDVSNKLRVKLSGADEQQLAKNYTVNPEAYKLYLQGRYYANKRTSKDLEKSIEYFNQAVAVDQNYALAFAGLADSYALLHFYSGSPAQEMMAKAKDAALKALSLDNDLAEAHAALGLILNSGEYDFAGAERQFKRAIELNPNFAAAHQYYAELLMQLGRYEESIVEIRRALEIDPLSLIINGIYGDIFRCARRYDESVTQSKKTLEIDPNFAPAQVSLFVTYWVKGNHSEAVAEYAKYQELVGNYQKAARSREVFAQAGWKGFLQELMREQRPDMSSFRAATLLAELGEKDQAFAELEKSYEKRESSQTYLKADARLDPLRDDPRFQELLRKVGFPP